MHNPNNPFSNAPSVVRHPMPCLYHRIEVQPKKACSSFAVPGNPDHPNKFQLCAFHIRMISYRAPKHVREREVVVTKFRRRTLRTTESERLQREVDRQADRINRLERQLDWAVNGIRKPKRDTPLDGTIYYLRIGGFYKIGWTSDITKRMRGYPPDTALLATHPGTRQDENKLHKKFAHLRTHGREWYPLAPQVTEHIDRTIRTHGTPEPVHFSARAVGTPRRTA